MTDANHERHDDGDDKEYDKFAELTSKLIKVPKTEIDEQRKSAAANLTHGET